MVDGTKSPVLKRKREGADPLWKKVKTRRKSDAAALQNGEENVQIQDVATPKPNAKASKETLVNGAHKGTPSTSRSDQKSSNTEAGKGTPGVTGPAATPAIPGTKEGLTNGIPSAEATPSTVRKQKKQPKPPAASISMGTQKKSKGTSKNTPSEIPKAVESQQTPSRTTLKSEQAQDQPAAESGAFVKTENSTPKTEQSPGRQKHKGKSQDLVRQGTAVKPKEKNKEKKKSRSRWSWSPAIGGWFLSEDPVFTNDEKCLLLANTRVLYAYATDSSTLVRTLSKPSSRISTYALSASNPSYVYTASDTGLITLWDWTDGKTVGRWDIGTNVRSITVVADPVSNMDLVYSHETGSSHIINVHALRTREQSAQTELKQILKKKATIRGMQVLLDGKIVIVTTHKSVLIGRRSQVHKSALQDYEFVWREIQSSKPVTGFDAYVRIPDQPATGGKLPSDAVDHIDLAVGDQEGVIWLFEDALSAFTRIEKTRKDGSQGGVDLDMLRPKRLHWHREAVASVKWSRDGMFHDRQVLHQR
jgi:NET1-associated nuclear protein 1 (U3 small nucleolar RNA-associated protein 17)